MYTSNPTTVNDSGVAQADEHAESVVIRFIERTRVELSLQKRLSLLSYRIDPVSNIYQKPCASERSTSTPEVIRVEVEINAFLGHEMGHVRRLVVPPLFEEFQNSLISFGHPLSGFPHTPTPRCHRVIPDLTPRIQPINILIGNQSLPRFDTRQPISCCDVCDQIGTSRGAHRFDDEDATLRANVARRSCEPVVAAPARGGFRRDSAKPMNENENATQNGCGEQSGNNPWTYGQQVAGSTRWGVSGGASSQSGALTADGSGSQELRKLLLETVDKLTEASDDQIGASIGDVIERAYTHTEHSLGAIADYLQHLMDHGVLYKPEEATVRLVEPLEETLDDEEVTA